MFNIRRVKNPYQEGKVNQKAYWVAIGAIGIVALGMGIWFPYVHVPNPINQPLVLQQKSRASGFTMMAEAFVQKSKKSGEQHILAKLWASGPMHDDEVIRMEGMFSLITPDGKEKAFAPNSWTFADELKSTMAVSNVPKGALIKFRGKVYVYHREGIKVEREMLPDGSIRIFMNTGHITFRKVANSNPSMLELECIDLGTVHKHGLELMGQDKKTVSNRLFLHAGKQLLPRENLPFVGRKLGMEPYVIRQLIPKRDEPLTLVFPLSEKISEID